MKTTAILGPTGDLGSQLANDLSKRNYSLTLVVRKGSLDKLHQRVDSNKNVKIKEVNSLFNRSFLKGLFENSDVIFNLTGLVSLKYAKEAYPTVLLVNGFFQGICLPLLQNASVPFIYASTQRIDTLKKKKDLHEWVDKAIKFFNITIVKTVHNFDEDEDLEEILLSQCKQFMKKAPIPDGSNIYELSKAVGEEFLKTYNKSIILRVSSVYGPGCFARRTIGRLILSRFLGETAVEKEEIRDYVYTQDFCDVFRAMMNVTIQSPIIEYCCSGLNISKSDIIRIILSNTPKETGILTAKILQKNVEEFMPSGQWVKKILNRKPTAPEKGILQTIQYTKRTYFSQTILAQQKRLAILNDRIEQKLEERGTMKKYETNK